MLKRYIFLLFSSFRSFRSDHTSLVLPPIWVEWTAWEKVGITLIKRAKKSFSASCWFAEQTLDVFGQWGAQKSVLVFFSFFFNEPWRRRWSEWRAAIVWEQFHRRVQWRPTWALRFVRDDMPFPFHSICFGNPLTLAALEADVKTKSHMLWKIQRWSDKRGHAILL